MMATNARLRPVSRETMKRRYIHESAEAIRSYVLRQLRGQKVCVIIDEMQKHNKSYINLLLSSLGDQDGEAQPQMYFLDCVRLRINDAESVGKLISAVVLSLREHNIDVTSYCSDNCSVMKGALVVVLQKTGVALRRIPCASHAMNLVLGDFMGEKVIDDVWIRVLHVIAAQE